jgi:hypothetical protein
VHLIGIVCMNNMFDARNMNNIKYEPFLVIQDLLQVYVTNKLSSSLAVIKATRLKSRRA